VSGHEQAWTTSVLSDPEQFPFWREVVWEAFVPVTLSRTAASPAGDDAFAGSVAASRIGPLGVASIASQAQMVNRTAADVRRDKGEVFFLNMPLRGVSSVAQDGRRAELGPGDFAVVDATRPFALDFAEDFEQLSLILPHEMLMPLLGSPEVATARVVKGDTGLGALAAGALRPLFDGVGVEAGLARPLAERLASLVALSLGAGAIAGRSRGTLTQAALDEVERSLGDPALTPAVVAERVGISTSYLHQLFSARGPSFGRWLLARRLARCRADLVDPELAQWTIGEIGWRNGFTDPSYLARAFRRAYEISPGEHRRRFGPPGGGAA
jgi:AraC family transcriptional activator of tynA and feaB